MGCPEENVTAKRVMYGGMFFAVGMLVLASLLEPPRGLLAVALGLIGTGVYLGAAIIRNLQPKSPKPTERPPKKGFK